MKRSAMVRAFQVFGRKPLLLLLLIPLQVLPVTTLLFLPDFSKLLDLNALMSGYYNPTALETGSLLSSLISSFVSLITFTGSFLLIPPAMELLSDGAAGADTAPGWYVRGLRRHWWKPTVQGLIVGAITAVVFIVLYIILIVVLVVFLSSFIANNPSGYGAGDVESVLSGIMTPLFVVGLLFGLAIAALSLIINSLFALFLPALTERSFGEAFRLLFSRKGLRQFPRILGGLLLIDLVPGILICGIGAAYILLNGIPEGPFGILTALMNFIRSGTGILCVLLSAVIKTIVYPFQFSVYQRVKDEEQAVILP